MTIRLIDSLYVEAMVLADEARTYFDNGERRAREALSPELRVTFACESLRVTTRLMHVLAWLLTRKAEAAGELDLDAGSEPERRLGEAPASDPMVVALLPAGAREVIAASGDLHARVARLDQELDATPASPALDLLGRLEGARF
jgi:regulator of CtrA degradation